MNNGPRTNSMCDRYINRPKKRQRREHTQLQSLLQTLCGDVASGVKAWQVFLRGIAYNIRWAPVNRETRDFDEVPEQNNQWQNYTWIRTLLCVWPEQWYVCLARWRDWCHNRFMQHITMSHKKQQHEFVILLACNSNGAKMSYFTILSKWHEATWHEARWPCPSVVVPTCPRATCRTFTKNLSSKKWIRTH